MVQEVKSTPRGFGVDSVLLWHVKQHHGIAGEEFLGYIRRSVKATHPKGNRRFHDWFFMCSPTQTITAYCKGEEGEIIHASKLREEKLLAKRVASAEPLADTPTPPQNRPESLPTQPEVASPEDTYQKHYKCDVCHDTKKVKVFNECEWCEGAGCVQCSHKGGHYSTITCQSCPDENSFMKAVKNLFKK